MEMSAYLSWTP